ncbi:unnamed protein product, partial [Musa banksii]
TVGQLSELKVVSLFRHLIEFLPDLHDLMRHPAAEQGMSQAETRREDTEHLPASSSTAWMVSSVR